MNHSGTADRNRQGAGSFSLDQDAETAGKARRQLKPEPGGQAVNAWSSIAIDRAASDALPARRIRRWHVAAFIAALLAGAAALALATGGPASSSSLNAAAAPVATRAPMPAPATQSLSPGQPHSPAQSAMARFTGTVGSDLTRSLESAGVPENLGREYVAILAKAIDVNGGLTVDDRFDLVVVRDEDGRLGELAFAGLDRVGRYDVQLSKWTDGREVRWIDADGLDPVERGMAMPVAGRISSRFGNRFHPVLNHRRMHNGVDVAARYGTPIVAAASGRVISAGWRGGYGRQVVIAHGDGLQTSYAHMSAVAAASGDVVRQGQVIGYVGSSGLSTGPHLHYEVRSGGTLVNPLSVKLTQSPLQGEELHAFRLRLRALLLDGSDA